MAKLICHFKASPSLSELCSNCCRGCAKPLLHIIAMGYVYAALKARPSLEAVQSAQKYGIWSKPNSDCCTYEAVLHSTQHTRRGNACFWASLG